MIQKTTFTFRAEPGYRIPWDAMTQYGQTAKVILSPRRSFERVQASAWSWGRKDPSRGLKLILRAQTFVIFELVPREEKTETDLEKEKRLELKRKNRLRYMKRRNEAKAIRNREHKELVKRQKLHFK